MEAPADVVAVYLYGSVARDTNRDRSDIDVAVLLRNRHDIAVPGSLVDRLEAAAGREADLVVLNAAPPDLVHRVLRDGIILLDRDRAARLRFEVQARNEYFDLEPIRRAYRAPRAQPTRS